MGFFGKSAPVETQPHYANPVLLPLDQPTAGAEPLPTAVLTDSQKATYDAMLNFLKGTEHGLTFSEKEQLYLTREQILRFLRATKWDLKKCQLRMLDNLKWRREYGVETLTAEHVEPEAITGKQILLGFDNSCRPCLYLYPGRQNTEYSPRQMQHLVWMLERTADLMPAGVETLALLVNYRGATGAKSPPVSQGRETLALLQNHYVERLGRALVIDLPVFIWGFFKIITPFMDPVTREKLIFNEELAKHVPPAQLDKHWGGQLEFEYKHAVYWPKLLELTQKAQERAKRNWEAVGGGIGVSEALLKAEPSSSHTAVNGEKQSQSATLSSEQHEAVNQPGEELSPEQSTQVVQQANQSDIVNRAEEKVDAVYVADSPAIVVKDQQASLKGVI
ncbi:CRAL/TRIO domain-containing protein [Protomyces lactucae-debilis]|uniref:CRAL/TRIO domain-containing protein n=1 Tax=Protomyces lactucae-debilis TaxID=2754530 RepID=A0A1Y2EUA8_PROLT|nr:CRAL/TRIO domain-containing protein [Protomyces lactucae-debilis]ORY75148.1 CRAL/TRIO domain-containing protein [Protomyces lactucae-debilis]